MTRLPIRLLAVALLLAASLTMASTAAARAPRRRNEQAVANRLTGTLVKARTDRGRRRAIAAIARALGAPVVSGARRSSPPRGVKPTTTWLYDFEVTGLAGAFGRGSRLSAADAAERLSAAGIRQRGGGALTGPALSATLAGVSRAGTRARRSPKALGALILTTLARRSKHPLTGPKASLDPIQLWLVEAALGTGSQAKSRPLAAAAAADEACFSGQDRVAEALDTLSVLTDVVKKGLEKAASALAQPVHGVALGYSLNFAFAGPQTLRTHFGPAGHRHASPSEVGPGTPLQFQVRVRMLDDYPEAVIRCGPLAGLKIPKKGPVAGVPIRWDGLTSTGIATLKKDGTITRQDDVTDAGGLARLIVKPNEEMVPGIGEERSDVDAIQPEARIFGAVGNHLGAVSDALGLKFVTEPFTIYYHKARGFKFTSTTDNICFQRSDGSCSGYAQFTYEAKMCGSNPFGPQWTGTRMEHLYRPDYDDTSDSTDPLEFTLSGPSSAATTYSGNVGDNDNRVDFTWLSSIQPQMLVDAYYSNNFAPGDPEYRTYEDHKAVAIEENLDCPAVP